MRKIIQNIALIASLVMAIIGNICWLDGEFTTAVACLNAAASGLLYQIIIRNEVSS